MEPHLMPYTPSYPPLTCTCHIWCRDWKDLHSPSDCSAMAVGGTPRASRLPGTATRIEPPMHPPCSDCPAPPPGSNVDLPPSTMCSDGVGLVFGPWVLTWSVLLVWVDGSSRERPLSRGRLPRFYHPPPARVQPEGGPLQTMRYQPSPGRCRTYPGLQPTPHRPNP